MKKRHNFFKSSAGFSLVEIMVAAGMLGVISLGVVQMTQNASKSSKAIGQQMEVMDLQAVVRRHLASQSSCTETLTGTITGTPGAPVSVGAGGATPGTVANLTVIYGRPNSAGTAFTGNVALNQIFGGAPGAGVASTGAVKVTGITVRNWIQSGPAINGQRFGTVDFRLNLTKGMDSAQADAKHARSSLGSRIINKDFSAINVVVDDATGNVVSCYQDQNQFLVASCDALSGLFDVATGTCKNIKISNSGTGLENTNVFSIIAQNGPGALPGFNDEGGIKAEGGLVVGDPYGNNTTTPGIGNAVIGNGLTVLDGGLPLNTEISDIATLPGDAIFQGGVRIGYLPMVPAKPVLGKGSFHATGNGIFRGSLGVGLLGPGVGLTPPVTSGDAKFQNSVRIGSTADPVVGEALRATGGTVNFDSGDSQVNINGVNNSASTINLNYEASTPIEIQEAGVPKFRVGQAGEITMMVSPTDVTMSVSSTGQIDVYAAGGFGAAERRIRLAGGLATASYRPSYIYNQPNYAGNVGIAGQEQEIPTKQWVLGAIYHSLSDNFDVTNLMAALSTTIQDSPFEAVAAAICDNIQVRNQSTGTFQSGTWSGGKCSISNYVCGDSSGQRCATHYATNYNATGTLDVTGVSYLRNSVVINQSGGSFQVYGTSRFDNYINTYGVNSYIYARNSAVYAGTFVYGTTYIRGRGVAKTGLSGVCGEVGCATKFGRYKCNGGGVVIGVANGHLVCALSGGGASNPVAF